MIWEVRREIIDFAVDGGPGVVLFVMQLEDGGRDAHELGCSGLTKSEGIGGKV